MKQTIGIAIHGGAGTILRNMLSPELELEYRKALENAVRSGYKVLQNNGSSTDAVEMAVRSLEDCPLFNAGRGAVFNAIGKHEMDASIMNGLDLNCGAISSVKGIKNPVSLARLVMDKSEHVFLGGEGAEEFEFEEEIITISAHHKTNLEKLQEAFVARVMEKNISSGGTIVTNARHYENLLRTDESLDRVVTGVKSQVTGDFLAMDIRQALFYLGEITGTITTEDLLDNIFSKFCIGK